MPNVDQLARDGARFMDAHGTSALCTPSRYGILTGRYHWRKSRSHYLVNPYEPPILEPSRPTLPRLLSGAGYGTACAGKWHLGLRYPARGTNGGFTTDESEIDFTRPLDNGPLDIGFDAFFGTAGCCTSDPPYCFIEGRNAVDVPSVPTPPELNAAPGVHPGLMVEDWDVERVDVRHVDRAIEYLDRHHSERPDDPFFLYLALSAPHDPWLPPDFVQGASAEGPRGDMNALVDWCVGRISDALDERGMRDDTLLIFTSDHGAMPGENGQQSAGSFRGQKNTVFEGGHRVPFIARWPGRIPAGSVSDELICTADLYATLADLLDVELEDASAEDSFSVLPALVPGRRGRSGARTPLRPVLVSDSGGLNNSPVGDFAIREGGWKLILLARNPDGTLAERRFPVPDALDGILLFDLVSDPAEETNIAAGNPEIVARLSDLLDRIRSRGARFLGYGAGGGIQA
jgi:arylsulfatase A-like enzyme